MQRCPHECTAPRDAPPTPIRAASSRARSPLRGVPGGSGERPDIRACARAAVRGVAWGGRARARALSRRAPRRVSDLVCRSEGPRAPGFEVSCRSWGPPESRDVTLPGPCSPGSSAWAPPNPLARALARPQARGPARSLLADGVRRPPGGAEGSGSGLGDWEGVRGG